jgi:membrane protein implicated in regulation of membrane protease activity
MKIYQIALMAILLIPLALSIPPIPTEFYGTATIYDYNSTPLPAGTRIDTYAGNISCGTFTIVNRGFYGVLTCLGNDNYTDTVEGAIFGQNIIFRINNETAQTFGDTVWYYGIYQRVNLTPIPRCGNGWCELTEDCITCQEDCGVCPRDPPGGVTPPSDGGGAPGTGGRDGTWAGGRPPPGGEGYSGDLNISFEVCQEDWICTSWQPDVCPIEGFLTRECTDRNNCGTDYLKPELRQACLYAGTCFDLIQNQDETDVDCGGQVCNPCDEGRKCIFDFDCKSGFCHPTEKRCREPTCHDGFRNQGEEGIDCGGPCPPCERPSLERPGTIVAFMVKGCGDFPWAFVLVASLAALLTYIAGKAYIQKVKGSKDYKKLKKIEKLARAYNLNRDLHAFILIMILLEVAISLYWYYLCELGIWLAVMLLVLIPLIVTVIIKSYVYDERRKSEKLRMLVLKHEDYVKKLIRIEREEIRKEELKAFDALSNIDYKKLDQNLALLLKDIRFLIEELLSTKDEEPFEIENSLADAVSQLDEYDKAAEDDEALQKIFGSLKFIEKIHRDILLQYKKLREDQELEKEIKSTMPDKLEPENSEPQEPEPAVPEKQDKPEPDYAKIMKKCMELDKEKKIIYLGEMLEKYPDDTKIKYFAASEYHKSGELGKAEPIYRKIIEADSKDKKTMYALASLYNQQKRTDKSYELYKRITEIDPDYMNTRKYLESLEALQKH